MYILLAISLFISTDPVHTDEVKEEVRAYIVNIENERYVSEALWSLVGLMISDDENRTKVVEIGRSKGLEWVEIVDSDLALRELVHRLSLYFENEHLHLFLQLQSIPTDQRTEYHNSFYSQTERTRLETLSALISEEHAVGTDDLVLDEWDFSTFLIIYNLNYINIKDDSYYFYNEIYTSLSNILEAKRIENNSPESDFLHASIFESLYQLDRFASILQYYDGLIELPSFPSTSTKRDLFWAMEFAMYRAGHIDRSLEIQRLHTIPLTHTLNQPAVLNRILTSHGSYLYNLGRFSEAESVFKTALGDSAHLDETVQTRLLNNLSLVYYKLGESDLYIDTQLRALDFAKELGNHSHQLRIYRNLHIYHRKNRNWDLALSYILAAQEIAESTNDLNELVSIIISKAVYYESYLGEIEQAYSLLNEADDLLEGTTDYRLKVRVLYEKAGLYEKRGNLEKSLGIYQQVLSIGSENNNDSMYLEALVDLADVKLKLDDLNRSGDYIREFNVHDVTLVDFFILVNARRIEAEIALKENRYRDSERIIETIYDQLLQRTRNTTDIEAGYWHIEKAYLNLFSLYAELLVTQNRMADLLNILDQLKMINDVALIENPLVTANQLSEEELTQNRRLSSEIDRLRNQLIASGEDERLGIQNEISQLNARMNQLSRGNISETLFQNINMRVVQSRLRTGQMVLHMTRIVDDFYLLMIDNSSITHKKLSFTGEQDELFEGAIHKLSTGNTDLELLHDIYRYLKLDEIPANVRSLIVVPDSYLYQLPLDVLPVSEPAGPHNYGSAEYLIEKMDIHYVNNLHELLRNEPRENYTYDFTGFGISDFENIASANLISLPKAPLEVHSIMNKLDRTRNNRAFLESEATPSSFNASASNSRVLHLASHSTISESDPLFSTLYLYPENTGNDVNQSSSGLIYAYQLFNMNLRSELIMLNSCESGSGEFFQGAGIMGISRALRYAGAKSLILNSWSVNDHFASEFAISFYSSLNEGNNKSEALRHAKMDFLLNKNANPHYWGPYMLNGNNRPLLTRQGNNSAIVFLMVLFAVGFIVTYLRINGNGNRNISASL